MKLGDESLGVPVGEQMHTYDTNCEFELKNIYDNMDHYFLSHCVNWTMAALILRDAFILNLWQVWDEVIELSWEHILPHFRECWWDHLILDMLIGNTIFIIIGLYIIKIFKIDYYDWLGRYKKKSIKDWEIWTK